MDKDYTVKLMNKIHVLTFFITQCEEVEPLASDPEEWHPDFEEAVNSILMLNEDGNLSENKMHEFNELYQKWSSRFDELGLSDRPIEDWEGEIEEEIYEILKKNHYGEDGWN
jgi:hypothetical protein